MKFANDCFTYERILRGLPEDPFIGETIIKVVYIYCSSVFRLTEKSLNFNKHLLISVNVPGIFTKNAHYQ